MKLIIAKSININIILRAVINRPCSIDYLEPVRNKFIRLNINLLEKFNLLSFNRIKMGRIFNKNNIRLNKLATKKATEKIRFLRENIYDNSPYNILSILNENYIKRIWSEYLAYELVKIYSEEKIFNLEKSTRIIYIQNKKVFFYNKLLQFINNVIAIEILRILVNFSNFKNNLFKKNKNKKILYKKTKHIILGSEPFGNGKMSKYFRNQKTISKNILESNDFYIIDLNLKIFYSLNKYFKIKNCSIFEFLLEFERKIPVFNEYKRIHYNLNLFDLFRTLRITYYSWSACREIKADKFIMNGNSDLGSGFLLLSELKKTPIFIYQYSLLAQMNPWLNHPLAGIMGFTKKHIEMYLNEGKFIKNSIKISKNIKYPFSADVSKKRIKFLQNELLDNFELSIGYFDENYCQDSRKLDATGIIFYEDYKEHLTKLFLLAKNNPKIAIVFKSQHCSKSLKKIIQRDPDLKKLYNPNQIFDIVMPTIYNDRNVVIPAEISKSVDITLALTCGGTAGYESLLSNGRNIFIRTGYSEYEDLWDPSLLIESIDDFEGILRSVQFNRNLLSKTNIGKIDINQLSKI